MGYTSSGDGLHLFRLIGDTAQMRELSVAEKRYEAVLAVVGDGETVTDVASRFGVARKTVHDWPAKYEAGGLEGLADRSHRPQEHDPTRSADAAPCSTLPPVVDRTKGRSHEP